MMMTCRLLCALLVLALCCYPSVCVTASGDSLDVDSSAQSLDQTQGAGGNPASQQPAVMAGSESGTGRVVDTPESRRNNAEESHGTSGLQLEADSYKAVQQDAENNGTRMRGSESASSKEHKAAKEKKSEASGAGHVTPEDPETPSPESVTKEKSSGSGGSTSGSANPMAQIGTNGTVTIQIQEETVPNTTTTTAPEAPSTTTTEAPTTTTTRAPSRLREIDGSLSSSAWVCAPLLLAVSALAYTTLG
ncbi:mucin TcMUCII, putative [Trypanosoma cruzi marinkellei]|uniref:Mucin TcMUCII, putative n=1 Tax=Trypanosoma cruzi marinkellei TaxID=85056 RepID=K2MTB0_TRYCR|nr:mucin TcMUCII, putative [Trypanosoma cruzi marinkellei]